MLSENVFRLVDLHGQIAGVTEIWLEFLKLPQILLAASAVPDLVTQSTISKPPWDYLDYRTPHISAK
jgi:hypothetical protein